LQKSVPGGFCHRCRSDNNILERDIRVFATGRKSWLFSDTADGAKASQ